MTLRDRKLLLYVPLLPDGTGIGDSGPYLQVSVSWGRGGWPSLLYSHLLIIRHLDFPGFFHDRLRFELLLREPMLAGVKGLMSRNAGKRQVSRVRVKVHEYLHGLRVYGAGCASRCGCDGTWGDEEGRRQEKNPGEFHQREGATRGQQQPR